MNDSMVLRQRSFVRLGVVALSVLLALCVAICMVSPAEAQAKTYKIKSAKQWSQIAKHKGGTFKLMKNITLKDASQYLVIKKNKKYIIDLNGHKVTTGNTGSDTAPLTVKKGKVFLKSSKKNKGVLYSTEMGTVHVTGTGKLWLRGAGVVNDYVDFRNGSNAAFYVSGKGKLYLNYGTVMSIGNGVYAIGKAKVYTTGAGTKKYPVIRAAMLEANGLSFTHYGSAILVASANVKLSLKGGSFGTKSTPDAALTTITGTTWYPQSGHYPMLDTKGKALKIPAGYKCVDLSGARIYVTAPFSGAYSAIDATKRITTQVSDKEGYYIVYILKA